MSGRFWIGAVSNCWAAVLDEVGLEAQCRRGHELGFRYVELRQRALGDGEERVPGDERPWPRPDRLAALAHAVPELGFNLAVEAPFMTAPAVPGDPYLRRCAEAARAVGGQSPVLRLVDLSAAPSRLDGAPLHTLARNMAELAVELWELRVHLALENAKQPLSALQELVEQCRAALPAHVPAPRICWDAHNQVTQTLQPEDPLASARALPLEGLYEFHFKQVRGGELLGDVQDGALDWPGILRTLTDRGYSGPALFEIPPGPDIWERLERSCTYIRCLIRSIDGA